MSGRFRFRSTIWTSGSAVWRPHDGLIGDDHRDATQTEEMVDHVGNYPQPNPLNYDVYYSYAWSVHGPSGNPTFGWDYADYPSGSGITFHLDPSSSRPSDNSAWSSAMARTNPNRPNVDGLVSIAELRELPALIKGWGENILSSKSPFYKLTRGRDIRHLPRASAEKYLEWQFGIAPIISDVAKCLRFQELMDKRLKMLSNLSQGSTTRSATVWQDTSSPVYGNEYVSGLYFEGTVYRLTYETSRRLWVSTKWVSTAPLPKSDSGLRNLALRATYGLDYSLASLWEAMPWSWLIDWFSNIGDLAQLSRGTIPVTPTGSCIMMETNTKITGAQLVASSGSVPSLSFSPGYVWKERRLAPIIVAPEFNFPMFTGTHAAILSSIGVLKGLPRVH